jgi:geranylgeranyl diphosphate synthase type I
VSKKVPDETPAGDIRPQIQACLDQFLAGQKPILEEIGPETLPLWESAKTLLNGGKRLRPLFCYWGWSAAFGDPSQRDSVITAASSLEFLQACALIHDDVMDGSDTRRGLPAAHRQFASMHRGSQWLGIPDRFGEGAAILLGDLCLSWADQLLLTSGLPAENLNAAKSVYDEMRTELMAGQYLDLLEQARGGGSVERALRVVRYKSAKYTIERPLHIGAALALAPQEVFDAYTGYGLPLGEAFQLRDDILGVFGDPEVTGKPAGDDLREGKRTVLIAIATERANPVRLNSLHELLGDEHLSFSGIETLREIIRETGALDYTESLISQLLDASLTALNNAPLDQAAVTALTDLAHKSVQRSL